MLVNFWASYCKPCREEMPALDRLRKRLGKQGFEVIGVDVAEDATTVKQFLAHTPVGFPLLLDQEGLLMARWQAIGLPTSFLIDRQGRVRAWITGGADWDAPALLDNIRALLAQP